MRAPMPLGKHDGSSLQILKISITYFLNFKIVKIYQSLLNSKYYTLMKHIVLLRIANRSITYCLKFEGENLKRCPCLLSYNPKIKITKISNQEQSFTLGVHVAYLSHHKA